MNTQNVTIEQLAERFNTTVWTKGDLKRIYLNDEGYNTKKMSTKTFIYEKDGEFFVSCRIECPSQPYQWIKSQEEEVKQSIYNSIEDKIYLITNPESSLEQRDELIEKQSQEKIRAEKKEVTESKIKSWTSDFERAKQYQKIHMEYEAQSDEIKSEIDSIYAELSKILGTPGSRKLRAELEAKLSQYKLPQAGFISKYEVHNWIKEAASCDTAEEYIKFRINELEKL